MITEVVLTQEQIDLIITQHTALMASLSTIKLGTTTLLGITLFQAFKSSWKGTNS